MKLYDYYRSTASYRVRIALHYKKIQFETQEIHLINNGGEHHQQQYRAINPQELIPTLETPEGCINQSLAIIEYLDETVPEPTLLPKNPIDRAHVRSLSQMIACDIHPLNNLRVLNQLKAEFEASDDQITTWYHRWLKLGLDSIEEKLGKFHRTQPVCYGDSVTLADLCLIPQVYNANRFHFPLNAYPLINAINAHCNQLEPFKKAAP